MLQTPGTLWGPSGVPDQPTPPSDSLCRVMSGRYRTEGRDVPEGRLWRWEGTERDGVDGNGTGRDGTGRTQPRPQALDGPDSATPRALTVNLHVPLQIVAPDEGLIADVADVRPFARLSGACERPHSPVRALGDCPNRPAFTGRGGASAASKQLSCPTF